MPLMDGLTATRAIRAMERERGAAAIPIIALTANVCPQDVEMSREAGCTAHISKPVSKQELFSVIEEYRRQSEPHSKARGPIRVAAPEGVGELIPGYLS